jgi:hypothetical protein
VVGSTSAMNDEDISRSSAARKGRLRHGLRGRHPNAGRHRAAGNAGRA